jgi:hypothetical protein
VIKQVRKDENTLIILNNDKHIGSILKWRKYGITRYRATSNIDGKIHWGDFNCSKNAKGFIFDVNGLISMDEYSKLKKNK